MPVLPRQPTAEAINNIPMPVVNARILQEALPLLRPKIHEHTSLLTGETMETLAQVATARVTAV